MDEDELSDWFDRQHVEVLRTHATTFTGIGIGAFLTRRRFLELLPGGPRFPATSVEQGHAGPGRHLSDSTAEFVPDIATLSPDGRDKDLGHCLGSFVNDDGSAHPLCCRSHQASRR